MKTLQVYVGTFLVLFTAVACNDSNEEEVPFGMFVSESVNIAIQDQSGTDLLDPANPDALSRFKVYYLRDGEKQLYTDPLMDAPNGFVIEKFPLDEFYHLQIFLNAPTSPDGNDSEWTTYLEFEDGHTDTIVAHYDIRPSYLAVDQASYNGIAVWDRSKNNGALQTYILVVP